MLRAGLAAAALVAYAVMSLAPFDWELPRSVANGARPSSPGWDFPMSGIVVADAPLPWFPAAQTAESLEVSLEVRPRFARQSGPARIVTISRDAHLRNLTLAQEDDDLILRLRSEDTDLNGRRNGAPVARVPDVFQSTDWVAIDLHIRPGTLSLTVDGRRRFLADLPPTVLGTWDPAQKLALGNETTCDRPWLGKIRSAVVRVAGDVTSYAGPEAAYAPESCWAIGHVPVVVPFQLLLVEDAVRNVLMYVPFGVLVGLVLGSSRRRSFALGLAIVVAVSLSFEITQVFVASRFPSVDDTIYNTLGGTLGLLLARWLPRPAFLAER